MVTLRPGRMGGSETYARGLLRALREHGELDYRELVRGDARLDGLDAIHYPFTIAYPRTKLPAAVTVHDVLHREALRSPRRLVRRFTYDRSSRRADAIIVPSEFVRGRVRELLGIPEERIRVVHHGIDHDRFRPGEEPREGFLFYPAEPWPHKNHARLFQAFARLRAERPGLELVLTGTGFRDLPPGVRTVGRVELGRAALAVPPRRRARVPEPVRGVRPAAARGDGERLPRRLLDGGLAAGGLRGRGRLLRSRRPWTRWSRRSSGRSRASSCRAGSSAPRASPGRGAPAGTTRSTAS